MNAVVEVLDHPLARQLGWGLLHSVWQGALIGVVFALCRLALKGRSADLRYLVSSMALVALVTLPMITFLRGALALSSDVSLSSSSLNGASDFVSVGVGSSMHSDFGSGTEAFMQWGESWLSAAMPFIVAAWFFGVVVLSLRLARGCWWVKTISTCENEPADSALLNKLNDLRRRLGVSRPVRLLKSALVEVPTVVGWIRPVILLPAAALIGLTPRQLEVILAHELVHVKRLDYLVNTFQCVVETLMFYHPVVWWVSRIIREEREHCCDDRVIEICGNRLAYARALATLEAQRRPGAEFAFAASGGSLVNRIQRLVGLPVEENPAGGARFGGLALLAVGLVLIVAGGYLMLSPKTYRAETRIRVEQSLPGSTSNSGSSVTRYPDPNFLPTEFAVIQSQAVLGDVVRSVGLGEKWLQEYGHGKPLPTATAVELLKRHLQVRQVPNTHLLEISVSTDDADRAAALVNGIAETYRAQRANENRQHVNQGLDALRKQCDEQEARIRSAQNELDVLRQKLDISDTDALRDAPTTSLDADSERQLRVLLVQKKAQVVTLQTQLDQLKSLSMHELVNVLPTTFPDALLTSLQEQRNQASLKLIELSKDYGPETPAVVTAKAQIKELDQRVDDRVSGIMKSVENQLSAAKSSAENLNEEISRAKRRDLQTAEKLRPYFRKKRELDELMRFKQAVFLKLQSETVDAALPNATPLVQIIDRASPPDHPSSPNRTLAGALIAVGILLDLAGLITITASRNSALVKVQ